MAWIAGARPAQQGGEQQQEYRVREHSCVESDVELDRERDRQRNPAEQRIQTNRQEQARDSSEDPDPESFGEELLHEPQAAGAKGDPDGHLAPPHVPRASSNPATFAQAVARISAAPTSSTAKKMPTSGNSAAWPRPPTGANRLTGPIFR